MNLFTLQSCHAEAVDTISEKLKHKFGVQPPPKILVEQYLIEISKNYNIPYEPDPQVNFLFELVILSISPIEL